MRPLSAAAHAWRRLTRASCGWAPLCGGADSLPRPVNLMPRSPPSRLNPVAAAPPVCAVGAFAPGGGDVDQEREHAVRAGVDGDAGAEGGAVEDGQRGRGDER